MASAYPTYHSSGLPWAPRRPEGWQVLRNGRLFGHRVETGFPDLPILEVSLRTGVTVRDMENLKRKQVMSQKEKYKRAAKGDIAYNMMRMWQGAVGPAPVDGLVSPAYVVVKPYDEVNSSYYSYLFRTAAYMQEVNKFSRGIVADRNRLYWESFKQMPSLVPPRAEQDQIVAYLRAQDAHIARFIKAKRDLIKLLTEQKLRIIDHAVTRGLDVLVPLKPSGVEWLGEVPEHWEVMPLKRACVRSALYGANIPATHYTDIGVRFLRTTDILESGRLKHGGVFLPSKMVSDYLLTDGDILLSRSGTIGRSFLFRADQCGQCSYAGYLVRFSPANFLFPDFLFFYTKTRAFADFIKLNAISTTIENLNGDKYAKMAVPVPPLDEQRNICRWITNECQPLDDAIARTEEEIKLIREYRGRLIADVVTGQTDVRGWQPGPEDVVDDTALADLGDDREDVTGEEDGDGED